MSRIVLDPVVAPHAIVSPNAGAVPRPASTARDWFALLKPRVVVLVVLTGAIGLAIAPGHINPFLAAVAIFCIALGAGAAGAINMWYDRDIDLRMRRTATRPIPAGRIDPTDALIYGVGLSVLSVALMDLATNLVAASWLALSIAFYVVVYTMWLKRRTPQNIVIGGAAGAFPPIIGWAAVTGGIAPMPILLFAIVFFWTPPHFWSLSLYACGDYSRAGVPMLPVVKGRRATRRQIVGYAVVLLVVSLLPWALGTAGRIYGISAAALGLAFLGFCLDVLLEPQDAQGVSLGGDRRARRCFRFSLLYLALIFVAVAIDSYFR